MSDVIWMKSCPFCGSDRVSVHHKRAARKAGYQVLCLNCKVGQTQIMHGSMERAAEVWNTRAVVADSKLKETARYCQNPATAGPRS